MSEFARFRQNEWKIIIITIVVFILLTGVAVARAGRAEYLQSPLPTSPILPPDQGIHTVYVEIQSGADDGLWTRYEYLDNTSTKHWIGPQAAGMSFAMFRFANVPVPRGVSILEARLFLVKHEDAQGNWRVNWYAEAADDSLPLVKPMYEFTRTLTMARIQHAIFATYYGGKRYVLRDDLTPIIREVVSRPGWRAGNALTVVGVYPDDGTQRVMRWRTYDYGVEGNERAWLLIRWSRDPQDDGAGRDVTPVPTEPLLNPQRTPQFATWYPEHTATLTSTPTATPTSTSTPTATSTSTPTATPTLPPCINLASDAEVITLVNAILAGDLTTATVISQQIFNRMPWCYE